MSIHVWKGPAGGENFYKGCSAKSFMIAKMEGDRAEGTITLIDNFENGIVFSRGWEALKKQEEEGWLVWKKDDETGGWKFEGSEEVHFTIDESLNAEIKTFVSERIDFFVRTRLKRVEPVKMSWRDRVLAMNEGRLFRVGSSFVFAAQIPDYSVGCSGSRCSNCGHTGAYCHQRCLWCGLPFVGPTGFPQIKNWKLLNLDYKKDLAKKAFGYTNHGRHGYANVEFVPLTPKELQAIELLEGEEAQLFRLTHHIHPREIRHTLFYK